MPEHAGNDRPRVLGIVGTMVWDTIWRESSARSSVEEWGGISYALAAADAVCPADYVVRPITRLGHDLAERGYRFLRELSAVESLDAVSVIDSPHTRVELTYQSNQRRCERIQGTLPAWTWSQLAPRVAGCDALYVNFITGLEFDLAVAKQLRWNFEGPIYADLHSLLLAIGPRGERRLRPLARWSEWLACFDAVQVNGAELETLSSHWGDPWAFASDVVGRHTPLLLVTLGAQGAAYVVATDALPLGTDRRAGIRATGPVRSGRVPSEPLEDGDPTGCGDVWGITAFCGLLAGRDLVEAMRAANDAAGRNVNHHGAVGLQRYLRGEIERG